VLFFVLAFFTWVTLGDDFFGFSLRGWDIDGVTAAFVLFLLATAWAVLPAVVVLKLGFPRSWVTVGIAALGWLLTLFAWLDSLEGGFSVAALLGFLTATAILAVAGLSLIPEIRNRSSLPAGLANAAHWANQPAPDFGQQGARQAGYPQQEGQQPGQQHGHQPSQQPGQQPYGQPQQSQYSPPPPPPPRGGPAPPSSSGGSTASGEGTGTPGSGERPGA
jgi:hypothetical protein